MSLEGWRVGFIGLGRMGGPMATHLLRAGATMTVRDLDPDAVERLAEFGAEPADSPATVGRASDVVFVSAATAWECAIKVALGKLTLPDTVEAGVVDSGFDKLLISFAHAAEVATLPNHHNDPFDRMLIAQARIERVALVTHDRALEPYSAEFLWV